MNKTKRRYVGKVYKSKVLMTEAVQELSPNAFKLLNLIYYGILKDKDLADNNVMQILGVSRRPYYKAKDELKEKGYISIVQVGSTKYKWFIGKKAIRKDFEKYEGKRRKDASLFADLVLNGIPKVEIDTSTSNNEVYVLEGFEQGFDNEIVI